MRSLTTNVEDYKLCNIYPKVVQARVECENRWFKKIRYIYKLYDIYKPTLKYIDTANFFDLFEDFVQFMSVNKDNKDLKSFINLKGCALCIIPNALGYLSIRSTINNRDEKFNMSFNISNIGSVERIRIEYEDLVVGLYLSVDLINDKDPDSYYKLLPATLFVFERINESIRHLLKHVVQYYMYNVEV